MNKTPRILFLEDIPADAELAERELRKAGIEFTALRVDTEADFRRALVEFAPDLILSDFSLPQFTGLDALRILHELKTDVPLILITGSLTEELAVECMREGATDYILKSSLTRLPSAALNALEKAAAQRAREAASAARWRSEEQYRELFENANDLIYTHDLAGNYTSLNKAGERITGYTRAEAVCMNITDMLSPEQLARAREMISHKAASGGTTVYELDIIAKDGHHVSLELSTWLIYDADSQPVGVQGIGRDITEHKRAERERDTERELLDALFEHLPVGVLLRDAQGRYTRANRKAAQIFEIEREQLIGMTPEELLQRAQITQPSGQPLQPAQMHSSIAVQTQQSVSPRPALITTPKGNRRRLVASAAPVALSEQGELGSVVVIEDVTEQHAIQEQLRQSQKMESIGLLAGGVAHDFNNLLTAIQGNAQLALRKVSPADAVRHRLLEVERAAQRAAVLTRQLLAFSRRQYLERKSVNLNDTINDIIKMVRRIIGEDVEVRLNEAADLAAVFADPTQLEQVIMNLAVNAREAMPHGGLLIIETRNMELDAAYCRRYSYVQPGRYVEIKVSDTGCGMDAATQARIFEPFFTTKEMGKGTGLGLSTVYGIVKQHDGHINVYSEVGHGTIFRIYLPVHERPAVAEPQAVPAPLAGGTETILVAEDEAALRDLARDVLEGLGYKVLLAKDGAEAVALYEAERERIDLLLLDVVMPHIGGHEAYERMRALNGTTPVIFMTGYSTETVQSRFVKHNRFIEEAGAVLLQKPYNVEGLGRKVREMLDSSRKK